MYSRVIRSQEEGGQGMSGLLGWYVGLSWINITVYCFFSYDGVGRLFVVVQLKQQLYVRVV